MLYVYILIITFIGSGNQKSSSKKGESSRGDLLRRESHVKRGDYTKVTGVSAATGDSPSVNTPD